MELASPHVRGSYYFSQRLLAFNFVFINLTQFPLALPEIPHQVLRASIQPHHPPLPTNPPHQTPNKLIQSKLTDTPNTRCLLSIAPSTSPTAPPSTVFTTDISIRFQMKCPDQYRTGFLRGTNRPQLLRTCTFCSRNFWA